MRGETGAGGADAASGHVPSLDGVRGIAILLVLLLHSFRDAATPLVQFFASAGWIGVDLFFALSGYLITGILMRAKHRVDYFKSFYARRALRLMPAYGLLLAALAIFGAALPGGADFQTVPWRYYLFYLQNYAPGAPLALSATWSLAIEEHFYLVWPLLVRYLPGRALTPLILSILFLSPLARFAALASGVTASDVYAHTPFRLDALAWGALVAVVSANGRRDAWFPRVWLLSIGALAAAGVLITGTLRASVASPAPVHALERQIAIAGVYSMLGAGFAATILLVVWTASSHLNRALSIRPLVFIGRISYGLYLYNWTVYVGVDQWLREPITAAFEGTPHKVVTLVMFILSNASLVVVAWLSFTFFERPFLGLKRFFPH